jgi:hypothetical protein
VARPYAFVKFGTLTSSGSWLRFFIGVFFWGVLDAFIQKTKKQYKDSRTQRNLNKLNEDLQDVTRIMNKNIQEVLGRGEQLDRSYNNYPSNHLLGKYETTYE